MNLKLLLYILSSLLTFEVCAQSTFIQPPISIKSPTAEAFETFTKFPISLYTGTPTINVPLHEISFEGIDVPIALSYNASGNRVSSRPTWVGLGWSLNVGGAITRKVNQEVDELVTDSDPVHPGYKYGYMYNFSKLNYADWVDRLDDYSFYPGDVEFGKRLDYEPDEFTFNFLGYHGQFFLNHIGEWQVIGENKIKIEVVLADNTQLRDQVGGNLPPGANKRSKKWIHKFTLTTGDGTKFEFGGTNATEYSIDAKYMDSSAPVANTWYLVKVTKPTEKFIEFTYTPDKLVDAFYDTRFSSVSNSDGKDAFFFGVEVDCRTISESSDSFYGNLLFPVSLTQIDYEGGMIRFVKEASTQLEYFPNTFQQLVSWYKFYTLGRNFDDQATAALFEDFDMTTQEAFGRNKLSYIEVYNYKKDIPKLKFTFTYQENSFSRIKLNSILKGVEGYEKELYRSFTYNSTSLPGYSSLQVDHWGFYNNSSVDYNNYKSETFDFNAAKSPNANFMAAEIIDKIYFNTGGFSKFIFEPHTYSKHVSNDRNTLINDTNESVAGGLRIKRIETYDFSTSTTPAIVQEYVYKNNFNSKSSLNSLLSSGILDVIPEYKWSFSAKTIDGNDFTTNSISLNSFITVGESISGSHIGYENVVELIKDSKNFLSGYNIHEFTNYTTDRWGNKHMDTLALRLLDHSRAQYSPIISRQNERGKNTAITSFNFDDAKVKEKLYKYQKSGDSEIRLMKLEPIDICSGITATRQTKFATAYKVFGYDYRLSEVQETDYVNSLPTLSQKETLTYNSNKLIAKTQKYNSFGQSIEIATRYTSDYSRFDALSTLNIFNLPVQTEITTDGKVTGGTLTDVNLSGKSIAKVAYEYLYESTAPISPTYNRSVFPPPGYVKKTSFTYNSIGKLIGYVPIDGLQRTYLWGYNNQYPVAEIKGATLTDIASYFNQSILDNPADDQTLRLELAKIRTAIINQNNRSITFFTYLSPFGVSSATDNNGITTYCQFDSFGRFRLTKDYQGYIRQMIDYAIGK